MMILLEFAILRPIPFSSPLVPTPMMLRFTLSRISISDSGELAGVMVPFTKMVNGAVEPRRASTAAVSSSPVPTVIEEPPAPPVVPPFTAAKPCGPPLEPPEPDEEPLDELLELLDELELDELDELELAEELLEELELDELDEELPLELELELLEEELPEPPGIEHSLTPPGTRVPAPKVTSPQTKLPLRILKVN